MDLESLGYWPTMSKNFLNIMTHIHKNWQRIHGKTCNLEQCPSYKYGESHCLFVIFSKKNCQFLYIEFWNDKRCLPTWYAYYMCHGLSTISYKRFEKLYNVTRPLTLCLGLKYIQKKRKTMHPVERRGPY